MRKQDSKMEDDSRTLRLGVDRLRLSCSYCPPNRGENKKRVSKHGARPQKSKDARKGLGRKSRRK